MGIVNENIHEVRSDKGYYRIRRDVHHKSKHVNQVVLGWSSGRLANGLMSWVRPDFNNYLCHRSVRRTPSSEGRIACG